MGITNIGQRFQCNSHILFQKPVKNKQRKYVLVFDSSSEIPSTECTRGGFLHPLPLNSSPP